MNETYITFRIEDFGREFFFTVRDPSCPEHEIQFALGIDKVKKLVNALLEEGLNPGKMKNVMSDKFENKVDDIINQHRDDFLSKSIRLLELMSEHEK